MKKKKFNFNNTVNKNHWYNLYYINIVLKKISRLKITIG